MKANLKVWRHKHLKAKLTLDAYLTTAFLLSNMLIKYLILIYCGAVSEDSGLCS